ncbi:MAG: hypothetical protein LBI86_06500 [Treponema sp.]|jgi:hypothetical protein|nr:hypothetical protein [Treponema sp.]
MDKQEFLAAVHNMTIEEKLTLLSDTDKAYLRGYLDRAVLEFQYRLKEPALPNNIRQDNLKTGNGGLSSL